MSDARVRTLATRLARVGVDLGDIVQELETVPLKEADTLVLDGPTQHIAISLDALRQMSYELETWGKIDPAVVPLTDAELREAA